MEGSLLSVLLHMFLCRCPYPSCLACQCSSCVSSCLVVSLGYGRIETTTIEPQKNVMVFGKTNL